MPSFLQWNNMEQLEPMSFPLPRHKSGDAVFKATIQIVLQLLKPLKQWSYPRFFPPMTQMVQLDIPQNRGGPPKSSILVGFSIINHPFWGTPIFGNTQLTMALSVSLFCIKAIYLSDSIGPTSQKDPERRPLLSRSALVKLLLCYLQACRSPWIKAKPWKSM